MILGKNVVINSDKIDTVGRFHIKETNALRESGTELLLPRMYNNKKNKFLISVFEKEGKRVGPEKEVKKILAELYNG